MRIQDEFYGIVVHWTMQTNEFPHNLHLALHKKDIFQ